MQITAHFRASTAACCISRRRRLCRCLAVLALLAIGSGCALRADYADEVNALPPLQLPDSLVQVSEVAAQVTTPNLLALDDEMRDFVRRYVAGVPRGRSRLWSLHRAIRGASLGISYDPAAEGSAQDVFYRGTANCLSYATLFVALAREAGLKAHYQWLHERPQWTLQGERVMVRLHVNTLVRADHQGHYMVDIDPLPTRDIAGSTVLHDSDAQALYHANIAMYLLADKHTRDAWLHSVRALQLSPSMAQLWVNLGVIYRHAGQHQQAQRSYQRALQLDPGNHSAMNNLMVLYKIEGRDELGAYWEERVRRHRDTNPYYYAWLADSAAQEGDWRAARDNYARALELLPADSRLLYSLGLAHVELEEPEKAAKFIAEALERATLRSDIDAYRSRLHALQEALAAGARAEAR